MKAGKIYGCTLAYILALGCGACGNAVPYAAPTSASEAQASSNASPASSAVSANSAGEVQIDLTDLEGLGETYLEPILFSAATLDTWTDANSIPADQLVDMYAYMRIWNAKIRESQMEFEEETPYYYLDETVLETYVQSYFAVSIEHLHSSDRYHADRKAYAFDMSGVGFSYAPSLVRAEYDATAKVLTLYIDDGYEEMDTVATLEILLKDDGSFQYIGNTVN